MNAESVMRERREDALLEELTEGHAGYRLDHAAEHIGRQAYSNVEPGWWASGTFASRSICSAGVTSFQSTPSFA